MQNASILLICLCVFTAIKISVMTEQQKSLFLYMQKNIAKKECPQPLSLALCCGHA